MSNNFSNNTDWTALAVMAASKNQTEKEKFLMQIKMEVAKATDPQVKQRLVDLYNEYYEIVYPPKKEIDYASVAWAVLGIVGIVTILVCCCCCI